MKWLFSMVRGCFHRAVFGYVADVHERVKKRERSWLGWASGSSRHVGGSVTLLNLPPSQPEARREIRNVAIALVWFRFGRVGFGFFFYPEPIPFFLGEGGGGRGLFQDSLRHSQSILDDAPECFVGLLRTLPASSDFVGILGISDGCAAILDRCRGISEGFPATPRIDSDPVGMLGISDESEAILDRYQGISEGFLARPRIW